MKHTRRKQGGNTTMTHAEKTARKQIGDGKSPNLYWIVLGSEWMEAKKPGFYDYASELHQELDKLPHPKMQTFGSYKTFNEAFLKMEELVQSEVTEPNGSEIGYHSVVMEDRLSGEIYSFRYYVTPDKNGIYPTTHIRPEWRDDTKYTREKLGGAFQ